MLIEAAPPGASDVRIQDLNGRVKSTTKDLLEAKAPDQVSFPDMVEPTSCALHYQSSADEYLAYAKCDLNRIEALKELNVKSTTGLVKAKLTDLPFNFEALGLGSQS